MPLLLHGSPLSNYYNKVKLALLEKGVPFEEVAVNFRAPDEAMRQASPLGKIPFVRLEDGRTLCESQVIVEWLEAAHPSPALLPGDPFAAAKVRELCTFIDWHVEMSARQLYGMAFFGQPALSEKNLERIRRELEQRIEGLRRLLRFGPFAAGEQLTIADLCAFTSLPLVGLASKVALGEDLLLAGGVDYKGYMQFFGQRPSAQRVQADRKAALPK